MEINQLIQSLLDNIVNPLLMLLFAVATMYFMWGVFKYVKSGGSEDQHQYSMHILWGIVGLAIMFSAYGIINMISRTVNPEREGPRPTLIKGLE